MMPHEAQKASMAASSLATAPVCAAAARPPTAVRPPNRAMTGLFAATLRATRAEAFVILDRFDIEQRRADLRPLAQPGEIVLDAEMHGVADRDDRGERQAARIGLVDEFLGERARLGDEGEAVGAGCGARRQVAQEGGGEAPRRIEMDDAGAVRSGDR